MINFLKESTFTVNDVIVKAWAVTKRNYFSIATLCFLMFITSNASGLLATLFSEIDLMLSMFMLIVFVLLYFTLNLSLFRYIFHLLDDENGEVTIVGTIPTKGQIIRFLVATILFISIIVVVLFTMAFLPFSIFYGILKLKLINVTQDTFNLVSNVCLLIGIMFVFITWLRLSFYPFFVLDKKSAPFESIKLSLAITKGNFTKIFLLLLVLGGFYLLYGFLNFLHWPKTAFIVNILSSFIIVPLSSVAITIAYRKMMNDYKGEENPDILHNIV